MMRLHVSTLPLLLVLAGSAAFGQAQDRPIAAQKTGQIEGQVDYCGAQGNSGVVVYIPGKSFHATLGAQGSFALYYVPPGTYTLRMEIPGRTPFEFTGVTAADNTVTDLGQIEICRDLDGDSYTELNDCNDNNSNVSPNASEECDGIDNDCDGEVDEACSACTDSDGDGFYAQAGCLTQVDCDDGSPLIRPGAVEQCDTLDNNCDGVVDEGFALDSDPSNCGSCSTVCSYPNSVAACVASTCEWSGDCFGGYADCNLDPADFCETDLTTDSANCGACGVVCPADSSCVGGTCFPTCFDADLDGVSTCDGDCDDSNDSVYSGAAEVCGDDVDNDCNGEIDESCQCVSGATEACSTSCGSTGTRTCSATGTWSQCSAPAEACNGVDDDCDGIIDNGCPLPDGSSCTSDAQCTNGNCNSDNVCGPEGSSCFDHDNDGVTTCAGDCNDSNIDIYPGAAEICGNGVDDDCDPATPDACN